MRVETQIFGLVKIVTQTEHATKNSFKSTDGDLIICRQRRRNLRSNKSGSSKCRRPTNAVA